ncbi:MAG: hypothetical protein ACKVU4_07020 [Phycisphaerales bacterium]
MDHARIAFAQAGADPGLALAARMLAWAARARQETFTKRDAWQALKGSRSTTLTTAAGLDSPLRVLVEHGYIIPLDAEERASGKSGRSPSPTYAVHPSVALGAGIRTPVATGMPITPIR